MVDLQPMTRREWLTTPSGRETPTPVTLTLDPTAADGRETLHITSAPVVGLRLAIRNSAPLAGTTLNGLRIKMTNDDWTSLRYGSAAPAAMELRFNRNPGATLEIRYMAATPGMPVGAPKPNGPPTNWTLLTGSSVVMGRAVFR